MPHTYRDDRIPRTVDGAEASRRVAWACFYEEQGRADALSVITNRLRAQVDDLLPLLLDLVHAVLHDKNLDAFAHAYRVQAAIDDWIRTNDPAH